MARTLMYSRTYPSFHPKAGKPTFFVEKLQNSVYPGEDFTGNILLIDHLAGINLDIGITKEMFNTFNASLVRKRSKDIEAFLPNKHHTIRSNKKRWNVGDVIRPKAWSGKPYNSKQVLIGKDIKVLETYDLSKVGDKFFINEKELLEPALKRIAMNDGMTYEDFLAWFPDDFEGQIICHQRMGHYI